MLSTMANVPPPLPPKTKRSPSNTFASLIEATSATVISSPTNERCCNAEDLHQKQQQQHTTSSLQTLQSSTSATADREKHVVKIRINPVDDALPPSNSSDFNAPQFPYQTHNSCIRINVNNHEDSMIRGGDNYLKNNEERPNPYFFYGPFPGGPQNITSSGQSSPSDTLDSGTCSDLDGSTPPPLPKKKSSSCTTVTVTVNGGHHKRNCSLTSSGIDVDSDDEGSNISCDSLNNRELENVMIRLDEDNEGVCSIDSVPVVDDQGTGDESPDEVVEEVITPVVCTVAPAAPAAPVPPPPTPPKNCSRLQEPGSIAATVLPAGLMQDIRERSTKTKQPTMLIKSKSKESPHKNSYQFINSNLQIIEKCEVVKPVVKCVQPPSLRINSPILSSYGESLKSTLVQERTYEDRKKETADKEEENSAKQKEATANKLNKRNSVTYDEDKFYTFHLNESFVPASETVTVTTEEETFAGYKDYLNNNKSASSTIRSAKGTVRGVKNRVRAGIATFLQVHTEKNYKEKEAGKIVVYTTTMGVVRATFHDCLKVKQILRTLMVKYEERDVMSREVQSEFRDRMNCEQILLPQLFVEGQHIGNAEAVERLNETGELRSILKPFKSADACSTCGVCGGYRLLPCSMCNGSKKSVHRNEFTAGFVALKCMKCDEVGLVKCYAC